MLLKKMILAGALLAAFAGCAQTKPSDHAITLSYKEPVAYDSPSEKLLFTGEQ